MARTMEYPYPSTSEFCRTSDKKINLTQTPDCSESSHRMVEIITERVPCSAPRDGADRKCPFYRQHMGAGRSAWIRTLAEEVLRRGSAPPYRVPSASTMILWLAPIAGRRVTVCPICSNSRTRIRTYTLLYPDLVGRPLMVHPGCIDRSLNIQTMVDHIHQHLQRGGDYTRSPGLPVIRKFFPARLTIVGDMELSIRLFGSNAVGITANQSISVRHTWFALKSSISLLSRNPRHRPGYGSRN